MTRGPSPCWHIDATIERSDAFEPDRLFVVDPSPVGDDIPDEILVRISACPAVRPFEHWLNELREAAGVFKRRLIDWLVARGILLRRVEEEILQMFVTRRYPVTDDRAEREVRQRIADVKAVRSRVEQIAQMDLIGREVSRTVDEVRNRSTA